MTEEGRKQAEEIFRLVEEGGWPPSKKPVRPVATPMQEPQVPPPYVSGMFEGLGFTIETARGAAQRLRIQAEGLRKGEGRPVREGRCAEHILLTMVAGWLEGWKR